MYMIDHYVKMKVRYSFIDLEEVCGRRKGLKGERDKERRRDEKRGKRRGGGVKNPSCV